MEKESNKTGWKEEMWEEAFNQERRELLSNCSKMAKFTKETIFPKQHLQVMSGLLVPHTNYFVFSIFLYS